MKEES